MGGYRSSHSRLVRGVPPVRQGRDQSGWWPAHLRPFLAPATRQNRTGKSMKALCCQLFRTRVRLPPPPPFLKTRSTTQSAPAAQTDAAYSCILSAKACARFCRNVMASPFSKNLSATWWPLFHEDYAFVGESVIGSAYKNLTEAVHLKALRGESMKIRIIIRSRLRNRDTSGGPMMRRSRAGRHPDRRFFLDRHRGLIKTVLVLKPSPTRIKPDQYPLVGFRGQCIAAGECRFSNCRYFWRTVSA